MLDGDTGEVYSLHTDLLTLTPTLTLIGDIRYMYWALDPLHTVSS